MNSPRDLRRRIKSIGGTAQITRAMQMVAASKMRKAQQTALAGVPFAQLLYRIQRSATTRDRSNTEANTTVLNSTKPSSARARNVSIVCASSNGGAPGRNRRPTSSARVSARSSRSGSRRIGPHAFTVRPHVATVFPPGQKRLSR